MKNNFEIEFLPKAVRFLDSLDTETRMKIFQDMRYSQKYKGSKFFKKLNKDIWEFRTRHKGNIYRLFAFWDKTRKSMVIATNGIQKKDQKTPIKEMGTAIRLMKQYYG